MALRGRYIHTNIQFANLRSMSFTASYTDQELCEFSIIESLYLLHNMKCFFSIYNVRLSFLFFFHLACMLFKHNMKMWKRITLTKVYSLQGKL